LLPPGRYGGFDRAALSGSPTLDPARLRPRIPSHHRSALRVGRLLPLLAVLYVPAVAAAQTAGKVEGHVTDEDTGQPLPGAQVLIEGTRLGNIADETGYYFINNVSVGMQTMVAALLGYQAESQQHRVLAGQTTTADFSLSSQVLVADSPIVTLTELDPLVPRDNTISKSRFLREHLRDLPLASLDELVTLAAGASENQGGISLRGGRPDDLTVYVENLNATDFSAVDERYGGTSAVGEKSPLEFGQLALEQLDVVSGGADASFGDLQSGVINIVTRRGGSELAGAVRFTTDALKIERTDDLYRLEGNVGGPLLDDGKGTFFFSGVISGSRQTSDRFGFDPRFEDVVEVGHRFGLDISRERFCRGSTCFAVRGGPLLPDRDPLPLLNIETFVEDYLRESCDGTTCAEDFFEQNKFFFNDGDPDLLPGGFSGLYSVSGKLAFTPSASTDLQLSYNRSREQSQGGSIFNSLNSLITKETVDFAVAALRQVFYQEENRSLALDLRAGYFDDRVRRGEPFDPTDAVHGFPLFDANRGGDDFMNFRFADYELFLEDSVQALIDNYREEFDASNHWVDLELGLREPLILGTAIQKNPVIQGGGADIFGYGVFSFPMPSVGYPRGNVRSFQGTTNNRERRWNVRADLDAQISRIARLYAGVDLKFFDIHRFTHGLRDRSRISAYFVEPRLYGLYATNRLDLGDFVLDFGYRLDLFDHNTLLPEFPGVARVNVDRQGSFLKEYERKWAFGPRVGVAHPVTSKTQLRLSYGVFNQLPGLDELYLGITGDFTSNDGLRTIGNPHLAFQRSKSFEVGLTHLLDEDVVLDLVAYNRDIEKGTALRYVTIRQTRLQQLFNVNNGTVRGFDVSLTKRLSDYWSADLTYSYLHARTTDSDQDQFVSNRGFDSTADEPIDPPTAPLPANYDLTHKLTGTFSLRFPADFAEGNVWGDLLRRAGVFATARFQSGLPYTRQPVGVPTLFSEAPNSSRRKSDFRADLRVTKYFPLAAGIELGSFLEVFNVFNNENLDTFTYGAFFQSGTGAGVYNTTGSRLLDGQEELRAEQAVTDSIVLRAIDPSTQAGRLTKEFRSFADIDGDGIVYPEEQRIMALLAFGAGSEFAALPKRSVRLGVELRF
jgi:hypothetical protein